MLGRKAARKVSEEELRNWKGAKFFIAHHGVMKPDSTSTPLRIVFNSSHKYQGCSLNDFLAKGPSFPNDILGIQLRHRENYVGFVGDISKMFHSIDIPIEDQMVHLFLWRDMDTERDPEVYAITVVNMGDKPSAAIAQTACLLYTSPSPRDRTRSRMPSSA